MDKFLEKYKMPYLAHEDTENKHTNDIQRS